MTTLRPVPLAQGQPQLSPTSSTSSRTTTPTSPHFHTHQRSQSSLSRPLANGYINGQAYAQPGSRPSTAAGSVIHPRPITPPLFRAPADQPFASYVKSWGNDEINQFLGIFNCSHHAAAFQRNDIDGKCILDLDTNNLKEIGIVKIGERIKIHNGIKDLRKRAAASSHSRSNNTSRVELRLNGAATPPLDNVPSASPGLDGLYTRDNHPASGLRRLGSARPPPLDLHRPQGRNNLPQAYQNVPTSIDSRSVTTPRPIANHSNANTTPAHPPAPSRNASSTSTVSTSSSSTVVPSHHGSSIAPLVNSVPAPAPAPPRAANLNLRAPPSRDPGRRSPSPVNADPSQFADRPLPPAPNQSSAAEYASAIRYAEGRSTPTWITHEGPGRSQPSSFERRNQPPPIIIRPDLSHRKNPSLGATPRPNSPVKNKFGAGGAGVRANTSSGAIHPFAANRATRDEERRASPPDSQLPPQMVSHPSNGSSGSNRSNRNAGWVVGTGGNVAVHRSASAASPHGSTGRRDTAGSGSGTLSLEDLRKQLVKFINSEDGTTRTVNVSSCSSGVEVLERVLKKFGKWGTGTAVTTDTESDEDGDQLEIDGWGVYEDLEPNDESKPLSEAALLSICVQHRDGTLVRDSGLVLRRTRKPQYRKDMKVFLGEAPPAPMSPTSPGYVAGPRLGHGKRPDNEILTPTKSSINKQKRASTVSVMSGLGVPIPDAPPSPINTRSPSSGSFLTKSKKMYNFFGHRPPSELISNHLADYFPSAKKRELEKTVRHSMLRMSMGPTGRRNSSAPHERLSIEGPPSEKRPSLEKRQSLEKSPPQRRPMSKTTSFTASPPADTIPEENEVESLPRVAIAIETKMASERARSSTDSDRPSTSLVESQPPLLPPFEPATETLSESLQAFSPTDGRRQSDAQTITSRPRPKSIMLARRGSAGSSRSRMSMLSQLRKNRDRSDTASMLTVDEITSAVEHRRASTITFEDSDEEEELETASIRVPTIVEVPVGPTSDVDGEDEESEEESSDDETEEDESEEEEDEDEEDDEDADHGKAFMSTGSKRIIKWIKGALIGAGSFGSVFLGMDSHSGLLMAVKQVELVGKGRSMERTKGMIDALEREVELLKELQHDNIVQYLDSSTDGDFLNIFLEYVPGGSVAALLNKYGAFEEALVKRFVRQILTGLEYLHARDIIHRDIKGANILVDNKGGIKISDFGISKKVESNLLHPQGRGNAQNRQSLQGSVFWMAPEVVKQTGHTEKADIWSVGCLVVEMLTGTHPWPDLNQLQAMYQIGKFAAPALPNDISAEAAHFLSRTFDLDSAARPTAAELLQHPFVADDSPTLISEAAARATMSAAAAARSAPPMQSLSALGDSR